MGFPKCYRGLLVDNIISCSGSLKGRSFKECGGYDEASGSSQSIWESLGRFQGLLSGVSGRFQMV